MAIDRWNPFQEMSSLRTMMDRLFHDPILGGPGSLPIDVAEDEQGYIVHASLPGFTPEEINVQIMGDRLIIQAQHHEQQPEGQPEQQAQGQSRRWLVRERHASVYRAITLPSAVDTDKAQAQFEHGTLTLTLPRAQSAQPRQIPIGTTPSQQPVGQASSSPSTTTADAAPAGSAQSDQMADVAHEAGEESFPASDAPSTSAATPSSEASQ
jgi:HSP20 family protein